jgi:hypothetical protein
MTDEIDSVFDEIGIHDATDSMNSTNGDMS